MMNEEVYMNGRLNKRNPFSVPEGYFDTLVEQTMKNLPAQTTADDASVQPDGLSRNTRTISLKRRLAPWICGAAACVAIAVFGVRTMMSDRDRMEGDMAQSTKVAMTSSEVESDAYYDEAADYAMLDNDDIYVTLLADL